MPDAPSSPPSLLDRLRGAFAVHPHGPTPVSEAVEADLAALARRRARVLAWAGLLVNLPLFYVDEYLALVGGDWARLPAYHWGLFGWRVVAVASLGAYLVLDRRRPATLREDRRLSAGLAAWFVLLGGAFGIWFEPNPAATPLYGFTLVLVAAIVHPPSRATAWAMVATIPLVVLGALAYGTAPVVVMDWSEVPAILVALALVVDRTLYRQAYRTAESTRLRERANAELAAALAELRETQDRLVEAERQSERTRISRDLHDSVGAQLSSLLAGVELARLERRAQGDGGEAATLDAVEADAREALQQLRETVWALHTPVITIEALAAQLRRFAESRARRAGMHAAVHAEGDRFAALPAPHALQLYRIGQEAVQNAVKHSGGTAISVRVHACDGRATIVVGDDGAFRPAVRVSGDGAPSGFGMSTMRDRAASLGGSLDLTTEAGTTVTASIPLAEAS